jgi:alpha-D-xyloside xylohydrolase
MKFTYVQKDISLELNKNIVSIAKTYAGMEQLHDGLKVKLTETLPVKEFQAKQLSDLNSFHDKEIKTTDEQKLGIFEVTFRVVHQDAVRVTIAGNSSYKPMVQFVQEPNVKPTFQIVEDDTLITLQTKTLHVIFDKKTCQYQIVDRTKKVVLQEVTQESSIYFGYYSPPLSKVMVEGESFMCQSFERSNDEDFYGFGEQFMELNKRGFVNEIWNVDPASTMTYRSYKNVPFFMSTKGYGIVLNQATKSFFDMGSKSSATYNIKVHGDVLDYYVMNGSEMKDVLRTYFSLTGTPALPPKWSFGLWLSTISTYVTDQALIDIAHETREKQVPADVLHIDPVWMGMKSLVCNFEWGDNFSEYKRMVQEMRSLGFKLSLWIAPYIPQDCRMYEEGIQAGYFVKDALGHVIVNEGPMNFWSAPFVYVDFTNPAAEHWFKQEIKRVIHEGGDVIKVDLGELGPEEAVYHNGMRGIEGHNFYTLEYSRVVFEATHEIKGDETLIWCRSGFIGSQKYPVHWAGDVRCDYPNMAGQLRAVLNAGMSGFVFFSHDIGGFVGEPTPDLYTRWYQFGMFTSHARCHGGADHEPWQFGDEVFRICKQYTELRYRLLPYIYSSAVESVKKGEPMLKALVLQYPDDLNVRNLDTQYLFGEDMLVAPVFVKEGMRKLYLPQGKWIDFWSKKVYTGEQWIEMYCTLDVMPLFVRHGSVIVTTEVQHHIEEKQPWNKLYVDIYANGQGSKDIYWSPTEYGTISYETTASGVTWKTTNLPPNLQVNVIEV